MDAFLWKFLCLNIFTHKKDSHLDTAHVDLSVVGFFFLDFRIDAHLFTRTQHTDLRFVLGVFEFTYYLRDLGVSTRGIDDS